MLETLNVDHVLLIFNSLHVHKNVLLYYGQTHLPIMFGWKTT